MDATTVDKAASTTATKVVDGQPPVMDDKKTDSSTENLPWHKDERFQGFMKEKKTLEAANAKLQKLLKENDVEDPDELEDLIKSGKTIKGKISDLNAIDEILEKAARLDSYENYWAEQEKKRKKDEEDPVERADRLERELHTERSKKEQEQAAKKRAEDTKKAIKGYENEVQSLIKEAMFTKDQEPFILEIFGVNNPSNDVDIYDKKAIKKLVADGIKRAEAFKQSVISEYLANKKGIVKTGPGSESTTGEPEKRIGLKEAHKIAAEQIKNLFRGG